MHPNDTALHDYADGSGDAFERASVEQHLAACASCRQLVDDLREITRAVATLEPRDPPVRAWSRIERAIKLEQEFATPLARGAQPRVERGSDPANPLRQGHGGPPKRSAALEARQYVRRAPWLAAAAATVLAAVVGLRYMPGRAPAAPAAADNPAAGEAAQSIESELRLAEGHYVNAIKGLEEVTSAGEQSLDPQTAATLHKNFAVIDQAISESRAAVRSQPASEPAQQSLIENFKTKIALLQDTVALINEMRKGNDSGAARIVSGLKPQGN